MFGWAQVGRASLEENLMDVLDGLWIITRLGYPIGWSFLRWGTPTLPEVHITERIPMARAMALGGIR
jgi:hypothetical protein